MVFEQASLLLIWEPPLALGVLGVPACFRRQFAPDDPGPIKLQGAHGLQRGPYAL